MNNYNNALALINWLYNIKKQNFKLPNLTPVGLYKSTLYGMSKGIYQNKNLIYFDNRYSYKILITKSIVLSGKN